MRIKKIAAAAFLLCMALFVPACALEHAIVKERQEPVLFCEASLEQAVFMYEDGRIASVRLPDREEDITRTFVCGADGKVFYSESDQTAAENEICSRVYVIDAVSGEEMLIAETKYNIVSLEIYEGSLYILEYDWRETAGCGYTERAFMPDGNGGYVEIRDNQYLYEILYEQGFSMFYGARADGIRGFYTIAYCKNVLGEILMCRKRESRKSVTLFDTEGVFLKEIPLGEKYSLSAADENYILSYSIDGADMLYHRASGEWEQMPEEDIDTVFMLSGGMLYYANVTEEEFGIEKISVYRYNIEEKERKLLYQTESRAGCGRDVRPGITGFFLKGNCCYFIDIKDNAAVWQKLDTAGMAAEVLPTGIVAKKYGFAEYGTAVCKSEKIECPVCGVTVLKRYTEGFRLYDSFPCAEKLNRILYRKLQNYRTYLNRETEIKDAGKWHDELHDEYWEASSLEIRLENVSLLRERYLEVSYDIYVYWGGAHGFSYREHLLLDTTLGKEICFTDVYKGSEEEFKKIAAEYTLNSIRENSRGYDMSAAKEFYQKIYQTVTYDMAAFAEDGILIEFDPYQIAEFGYSAYSVKIPYEELGIAW